LKPAELLTVNSCGYQTIFEFGSQNLWKKTFPLCAKFDAYKNKLFQNHVNSEVTSFGKTEEFNPSQ
jgi:hypothetical protein